MNLFIYVATVSEKGRHFVAAASELPSGVEMEIFETKAGLIRRLRQPKDGASVVILFDPSREDLGALEVIRQFLGNIPLLLVLSDQDPETLALSHRLLPSYITYVDSDLSQLLAVVRKLLPTDQEVRKS